MSSLPIQTKDNGTRKLSEDEYIHHLGTLKKLAEPTIKELSLEDHPNLLIFPQDLNVYGDKIGNAHVFEVEGNKLVTGNIMGFIGCGNTKVSISSRFAQGNNDYFLHYMLRKVFAINLFDLQFNSDEESIFDFLIYLFPAFLKRALKQGIYKEYQTHRYNDANAKGRIDIPRHIRKNIPFAGKIAYTTREYAQDNHLTQLIRHTIEYITQHPLAGNILCNDEETMEGVNIICSTTPTYSRNERQKVIHQNLRPISHPYFSEYRPLQQLCLLILWQEEMKYGDDDDEIYGVLFDGAWLWEEYLNTFLSDFGFIHPQNKIGTGGKRLFTDNIGYEKVMPDFYNHNIVLDAKYKGYREWKSVSREDRFQLLSYMYIFRSIHSGFIVPVDNATLQSTRNLNGYGGTMSLFGMNVSINHQCFNDYNLHMITEESRLKELILSIEDQ
ncbi:MAG: hypothetical protein IKH63_07730 [Prevotella sp.]|nr:hypothetical protein [Prevotella sp.]